MIKISGKRYKVKWLNLILILLSFNIIITIYRYNTDKAFMNSVNENIKNDPFKD